MEKEKSENKSKCTKSSTKSKKKTNEFSFTGQMNYKISKVNNILDQLLLRGNLGNMELSKLNNSFDNSSIELLQTIGGKNKNVGILMCLKFFKSICKIINPYKYSEQIF
jgi:hypothetical protein